MYTQQHEHSASVGKEIVFRMPVTCSLKVQTRARKPRANQIQQLRTDQYPETQGKCPVTVRKSMSNTTIHCGAPQLELNSKVSNCRGPRPECRSGILTPRGSEDGGHQISRNLCEQLDAQCTSSADNVKVSPGWTPHQLVTTLHVSIYTYTALSILSGALA